MRSPYGDGTPLPSTRPRLRNAMAVPGAHFRHCVTQMSLPPGAGRRLRHWWRFLCSTASVWLAAAFAALARFSARFSLRDLPDFLDIVCRGDLSDIVGPSIAGPDWSRYTDRTRPGRFRLRTGLRAGPPDSDIDIRRDGIGKGEVASIDTPDRPLPRSLPVEATPFGHYQLQELIGRGGMGEVYRAYDTRTDRVVALKVLPVHLAQDETYQQRFRRESQAVAGLNDPHVVPIHGFGEIDGRLYLDMRLIEGRNLGTVLNDKEPLDPRFAVSVVEQVAQALDSAHEAGLVHRDIKPSNILITDRDFVYLIDFGLARTAGSAGLTTAGSTLGTLAYMAPERFENGDVDRHADIYALTCVLYECLTGKRPYPGDTYE